jgi:membrane protein DedA with SNARE-associated domain
VSALTWNFLLLFAGMKLGQNWQRVAFYADSYSKAISGILVILGLLILARYLMNRSNANGKQGHP